MKKFLAMFMAVVMMTGFAACGSGDDKANKGNKENIESSVALLTAVWNTYGEDERFPAVGGGGSETAEFVDNAPGKFATDSTESLDYTLGMPADSAAKIDDAASLIHMMNTNTFTCGAFHVAKSDDVKAVADSLRDNIQKRQWMCGMPEKLIVITVDDYVISAFGHGEPIDTFKTKLLSVYQSAAVVHEEDINLGGGSFAIPIG